MNPPRIPNPQSAFPNPQSSGPRVGRGAEWVELVDSPINPARVRAFVGGDSRFGAIVTFDGATRADQDDEHGPLDHLAYEAYADMATAQMSRLVARAKESWPVGRVALVHRTGVVNPGEVSVSIAVACPHRLQAFEACRFLIDALKAEVPIWKKDVFADGFTRWVDPTRKEEKPENV